MNQACQAAMALLMLTGMAQGVAGQPAPDVAGQPAPDVAGQPAPEGAAGPTQDQLAEAVRLGGLATLAPICGLRSQHWAADLRRSAIQSGTRSRAHADGDLSAAAGSNLVIGALSFAESEALESFARAPGSATCGPLRGDPSLQAADRMVERFRRQARPADPAS